MIVRRAVEADSPAIVALLKRALGEGLTKKSEDTWRWKHIDNPFGESPVLVAEEEGELIGVRALMRWGWTDDTRNYQAVRAVDTATDPNHQGKGIFKKLTTTLLEEVKNDGVDFVFNTPNEKSMPGYLKMGWQKAYKLPVRIKPMLLIGKKDNPGADTFDLESIQDIGKFEKLAPGSGGLYPSGYFNWRYLQNPFADYLGFGHWSEDFKCLCIFRAKKGTKFNELRICELFMEGPGGTYFRKQIKKAARTLGCQLITSGYYKDSKIKSELNSAGFLPPLALGLQMTIRDLCYPARDFFEPAKKNNLALGIFELF